jgi:hypothetical protein
MGLSTGPTRRQRKEFGIRRTTYITGGIVLLCLLLASSTSALRPNTTISPCVGHVVSQKQFQKFAEKTWRLPAWERGKPPLRVIQAERLAIQCAAGTGYRGALIKTWRDSQLAFYEHRAAKLAARRYIDAITPPGPTVLAAIRECESGGDYSINTGNSFYGAFQFSQSTWASVGGSGLPSEAPAREQDERAARLYREQGSSPWPVCGV